MDLRSKMRARMPKAATGRWYDIRNDAGGAVVRIYSEIGYWGVTAEDFANDLAQISAAQIEVQINSPGGDVFDGLAIYNALRAHAARIVTRVDGIAASAASVIVQAGDHRMMMSAGQMMVHEAWGLAIGPASEMREFADVLDKQNDVLASIYADRSGSDVAAVRELMAAETWFTDQEAVDAGFADEVWNPPRKEAAEQPAAAAGTAVNGNVTPAVSGNTPVTESQDLTRPGGEKPEEGINQTAARDLLAAFSLEGGNPQ